MAYVIIVLSLLVLVLLFALIGSVYENSKLKNETHKANKLDLKIFEAQCSVSLINAQARDLMRNIESLIKDLER